MANGVTTQWHDIHVKLGNFEAQEKEKTQDEFQKEYKEKLEQADPLEKKTIEELKEMQEDALDEEDEKMFRDYLDKRKTEISSYKAKPKFGDIVEISRDEYVREVTNAPKGVYVVLHLYQDFIDSCQLINRFFGEISKEHPNVKFLKILSTKAIENYPDRNVPTVLIYKDGQLLTNLAMLDKKIKIMKKSLENLLINFQVLPKREGESDDETEEALSFVRKDKVSLKYERDLGESDSDDDREYAGNTNFRKKFK